MAEPNNTTVIYHANCMDGLTAAYVAWLKFRDRATYIPAVYNTPPPGPEHIDNRDVYILDFSYPRLELVDMRNRAASLVVLDHHKTAAKALQGLSFAMFDMDRSGARMAWDFFRPGEQTPRLVDYVEDRDLWRHKLPDTLEINAWLRTFPPTGDFERMLWLHTILEEDIQVAVQAGKALLRGEQTYVQQMAQRAYVAIDDAVGLQFPVVNASFLHVSELLHKLAVLSPCATAVAWSQHADGRFVYSLRSVGGEPDVAEYARRYGGGGHASAAGFTSFNPPWKLWRLEYTRG